MDLSSITLIGMSGTGKTHLSNFLRYDVGDWYHYSVDYRIGTHYMQEHIADALRQEAAKNPYLRTLLREDALSIAPRLTFNNLTALSAYLGQPGDVAKGGLPVEVYRTRQDQHRVAERRALLDTATFIARSQKVYGYNKFVCDTSGSICEVVDPMDKNDPVLTMLSAHSKIIYIKGSADNRQALIGRFCKSPKPMYYDPACFFELWQDYLTHNQVAPDAVDPVDFSRWGFERLIDARIPKYEAIAQHWGHTICAKALANCRSYTDIQTLITQAIDEH